MKRPLTWTAITIMAMATLTPAKAAKTPSPATQPLALQPVQEKPYKMYKPRANRARRAITNYPKAWQRLAWCESRYHLHAVSKNGLYHGLWQIHKGWFKPFGIDPNTATIEQQWKVAQAVYHRQGAKAWSCARQARFK